MSQLKFKVKGAKTVFWYARCDSEKATKDKGKRLMDIMVKSVVELIDSVEGFEQS